MVGCWSAAVVDCDISCRTSQKLVLVEVLRVSSSVGISSSASSSIPRLAARALARDAAASDEGAAADADPDIDAVGSVCASVVVAVHIFLKASITIASTVSMFTPAGMNRCL